MQQVEFPNLGKCDGAKYYEAILAMLQKVQREKPDDRTFKRYLRGEGWLDKDTFDATAKLLDLRVAEGRPVELGPWASALMAETTDDKRKAMLFSRLAGFNEILVKYVFDAVQERLYSTSELYRMLTSYVYPGKRVDLPQFKNWLSWLQATERIRVLGIRWAPGRKFEESTTYINSIDVDELLEDEAEDELFGEDAESASDAPEGAASEEEEEAGGAEGAPASWEPPADEEAPAPAAAAPPRTPQAPPAPASAASPASPASPAPPAPPAAGMSAEQLATLLAALAPRPSAPELIEARLLQPAPHLSALAAGAPLERVREAMAIEPSEPGAWLDDMEPTEEAQAENVRALLEWWDDVEDRPTLRADRYGVQAQGAGGWAEGSRARFLFRLACLAVSLLRTPEGHAIAFAVLDSAGFYGALFDNPGSAERLLDELFEQGLGGRPELFQHLHLTLMLARSLRGAESWAASLPELEAAEVYAGLWRRLGAFQLHEEVLWIVRELSLAGVLPQPELAEAQLTPTEEARRAAFHLGLLDTVRAEGVPGMLAASRRLTPLLGSALEAPLIGLWRRYGAHPPRRFWSR